MKLSFMTFVCPTWERSLTIQSGTLGEHTFTDARFERLVSEYPYTIGSHAAPLVETETEAVAIDATCFDVTLPPGTELRLSVGMKRCVNPPTYRFPWEIEGAAR